MRERVKGVSERERGRVYCKYRVHLYSYYMCYLLLHARIAFTPYTGTLSAPEVGGREGGKKGLVGKRGE